MPPLLLPPHYRERFEDLHWIWGLIDIPDVIGPDDHVNIGFHEVLVHALQDEDLPFVAVSELG